MFLFLGNAGRQAEMMQRKQEEYQRYVDQYFATKDQDVHQDTYRQIHIGRGELWGCGDCNECIFMSMTR